MKRGSSWFRLSLVVALVGLTIACASSGPRQVHDEIKAGYKAAKRGYWQEALMRFELAYKMDSSNPHAVNNYAVALEAVGRYEDAREMYEQAFRLGDSKIARRNFNRFQEVYESFLEPQDVQEAQQPPSEQESDDETDS